MAAGLLGSEDLLCSWDRLLWGLTSRVLRTCRGGHLRVLQLMLKPWCISRAVYQVGLKLFLCFFVDQKPVRDDGGAVYAVVTCLVF